MQGLQSNSARLWAPESAGVREPILILSRLLGTPENAGVVWQFRPLVGPREGRDHVANSDFVPFAWKPPTMQGLRSNAAHLWAPKKARVRQQIEILSPLLGTPENGGVTWHLRPFVCRQEGMGEVAGDLGECTGYIAVPPICEPSRGQG